jgi:hypothetical protein
MISESFVTFVSSVVKVRFFLDRACHFEANLVKVTGTARASRINGQA